MSEEWKDIKDFEGLYQVSNFGRVKSLNYNKTQQEKILKPSYTNRGYASLNLCKNGKIFHKNIHRLVAEAFIPNPNNYCCVNHKDENPRNNNVDNLEWCTFSYNMNYGTCAERRNKSNKISINQYDKSNNFIKKWTSAIDIQNEIGINQGSIIKCCRNKQKTAGGFIWRYENIRETSKKNLIQKINELTEQLDKEKEKNRWKPISEYDREKYDWVLVKYFDGDYECVPEVAEQRWDGKWYTSEREIPFEVKYFFDMQELLEERN